MKPLQRGWPSFLPRCRRPTCASWQRPSGSSPRSTELTAPGALRRRPRRCPPRWPAACRPADRPHQACFFSTSQPPTSSSVNNFISVQSCTRHPPLPHASCGTPTLLETSKPSRTPHGAAPMIKRTCRRTCPAPPLRAPCPPVHLLRTSYGPRALLMTPSDPAKSVHFIRTCLSPLFALPRSHNHLVPLPLAQSASPLHTGPAPITYNIRPHSPLVLCRSQSTQPFPNNECPLIKALIKALINLLSPPTACTLACTFHPSLHSSPPLGAARACDATRLSRCPTLTLDRNPSSPML